MITNYKYFKNSNTGELIKKQWFECSTIKNIPEYYYDIHGKCVGENIDLKGFVEISEKKFLRESKQQLKTDKCYVCHTEPAVVKGRCTTCHYDCP